MLLHPRHAAKCAGMILCVSAGVARFLNQNRPPLPAGACSISNIGSFRSVGTCGIVLNRTISGSGGLALGGGGLLVALSHSGNIYT